MIPNSNRPSILQGIVTYSRRGTSLMLKAVQHAYDRHMERVQMRLAPVKPRSWREIARTGAHHDYY